MFDPLHKSRLTFFTLTLIGVLSIIVFHNLLPMSMSQNQSTDYTDFYYPVAINILQGRGIIYQDEIAIRYPPGYPLLLAGIIKVGELFGLSNSGAVNLFIWACFGLTSGLIFLIGKILWEAWYSILPSLLWITYPFALWLAKQPNSEIPFMLFFLLSIYFCVLAITDRGILYFLLTGLMIGLAMLIKPIVVAFGLVLVIFWFYYSPGVKPLNKVYLASVFLFLNFLPAVWWGYAVYHETGVVVALSTGGPPSIRDGLTFGASGKSYRLEQHFSDDVKGVMEDFNLQRDQLNSNRNILGVIIKEFRKKPNATLKFFIVKALRSWYALDSMQYEQYTSMIQFVYLCLICSGGCLSWSRRYLEKKYILLIVVTALYFWSMTTLVLSILRYITPVFALLFLLVPGFVKWLVSRKIIFNPKVFCLI